MQSTLYVLSLHCRLMICTNHCTTCVYVTRAQKQSERFKHILSLLNKLAFSVVDINCVFVFYVHNAENTKWTKLGSSKVCILGSIRSGLAIRGPWVASRGFPAIARISCSLCVWNKTMIDWLIDCLCYLSCCVIIYGPSTLSELNGLIGWLIDFNVICIRVQLNLFLSRVCGEPIGFTVLGIFVIDRNTILTVGDYWRIHLLSSGSICPVRDAIQ